MDAQAYPLQWPENMQRSKQRERGAFRTSLNSALKNVEASLRAFARDTKRQVQRLVVSSNVTLGNQKPDDPGVAIWFVWDGISVCFAVDRYTTVEANLQAIHHIVEARRTEVRHGTLALVRATFQGFAALPPPPEAARKRAWREVLGIPPGITPSHEMIGRAHRERAKAAHPDAGGSDAAMAELNQARSEALSEIGN